MARLIVAIISWNTSNLTRECLQSLEPELEGLDSEIWVVDNNSSDDSQQMIREEFPQVTLICNRDNVGFARANNQILSQAKGDYYLLQNSDTIVPEGSVKALCRFLDDHSNAAAVGPRLHNGQGAVEPALKPLPSLAGEWRYCLAFHSGPLAPFFQRLMRHRQVDWRTLEGPQPAEVLSAASLLIRREVIEKVGLLPEDYFLFSEENDFFRRMKTAGMQAFYLPDVEMIHLLGMSRKKRGSIDSELNFLRSRLLYFRKFHRGQVWFLKLTYYLFFGASRLWSSIYNMLRPGRRPEAAEMYRRLIGGLKGS